MNTKTIISEAAEALDVLTSNLSSDHPFRIQAQNNAKRLVSELYKIASQFQQGDLLEPHSMDS